MQIILKLHVILIAENANLKITFKLSVHLHKTFYLTQIFVMNMTFISSTVVK